MTKQITRTELPHSYNPNVKIILIKEEYTVQLILSYNGTQLPLAIFVIDAFEQIDLDDVLDWAEDIAGNRDWPELVHHAVADIGHKLIRFPSEFPYYRKYA